MAPLKLSLLPVYLYYRLLPFLTLYCLVTMSYNETGTHKKRRIAHPWVFRGTASAPFVPAQDLRAHGNSLSPHPRPLSTAVLARTIGKLPKHHASASAKSRDVNSTGDLAALCWSQRSPATPPLREKCRQH